QPRQIRQPGPPALLIALPGDRQAPVAGPDADVVEESAQAIHAALVGDLRRLAHRKLDAVEAGLAGEVDGVHEREAVDPDRVGREVLEHSEDAVADGVRAAEPGRVVRPWLLAERLVIRAAPDLAEWAVGDPAEVDAVERRDHAARHRPSIVAHARRPPRPVAAFGSGRAGRVRPWPDAREPELDAEVSLGVSLSACPRHDSPVPPVVGWTHGG